jgi:hypothetical protein
MNGPAYDDEMETLDLDELRQLVSSRDVLTSGRALMEMGRRTGASPSILDEVSRLILDERNRAAFVVGEITVAHLGMAGLFLSWSPPSRIRALDLALTVGWQFEYQAQRIVTHVWIEAAKAKKRGQRFGLYELLTERADSLTRTATRSRPRSHSSLLDPDEAVAALELPDLRRLVADGGVLERGRALKEMGRRTGNDPSLLDEVVGLICEERNMKAVTIAFTVSLLGLGGLLVSGSAASQARALELVGELGPGVEEKLRSLAEDRWPFEPWA